MPRRPRTFWRICRRRCLFRDLRLSDHEPDSERSEQGTFSLTGFWERRIRRILPALFAVTIATLAAGWLLLLPDAYSSLGQSAIAVAALRANILFSRQTGYFEAEAQEKPLLHTWSLAVEEQFYLLIPVILFLFARRKRLDLVFVLLARPRFSASV